MSAHRRSRPVGRSQEPAKRAALVAGSLFVAVFALEIVTRLVFRHEVDGEIIQQNLARFSVSSFIQPSADPELAFELRPDLSIRFHETGLQTDAFGFRVQAQPSPEPTDSFHLVVLGDSTSFGWRVEWEESYPAQLRTRLEQRLGRPVSLRNFSVPGYNTRQELQLLRREVVALRPDLVILHHDFNDSEPTGLPIAPEYLRPEYGDNPLGSALIKFSLRRIRLIQNRASFAAFQGENRKVLDDVYAGPLWDGHLNDLRAFAETTRSAGIPTAVVIFDTWVSRQPDPSDDPRYTHLHQPLERYLTELGLTTIPLYGAYQQVYVERDWTDSRPWWVAPDDAHPGPANHRFIAEQIDQRLKAEGGRLKAKG